MVTIKKRISDYANDVWEFVADSETDISTIEQTTTTLLGNKHAGVHSYVYVISSGNKYFRDSTGNWNKLGGN